MSGATISGEPDRAPGPDHPIATVADVRTLFADLLAAGVNLHPDTPFDDYVEAATGERTFSDEQARRLDEAMARAFTICRDAGVDIYGIGLAEFNRRIGVGR